ncbi:MAG: nucleotide exchange factor GrpE [Bacteroidales bacterium]|nr:nucleotide exchange factor GrpE [Bacteroidales bacterium]
MEENIKENVNTNVNQEDVNKQNEVHEAEPKNKRNKKNRNDKQLEELTEKYDELDDKYLRLFSEFDNYRKRTAKEKIELSKTASESIMVDLLPILDDFERALQTMENKDTDANYEGVLLIYNKFKRTLEQKGLEEINAKDATFDTDEHEALTNVPVTDESQKGKVLDVIQKGYKLNGKVIRYARVVVGG